MDTGQHSGQPSQSRSPSYTARGTFPARRAIVALCNLFFFLLPLEGVLRKWLLPGLQSPLTLVRDPIVLLIMILYFRGRIKLGLRLPDILFLVSSTVFFFFGALQAFSSALPVPLVFVGVRNYVLYTVVALAVYYTFNQADLRKFIIRWCVLSAFTAALVVFQFLSPPGSLFNKGIEEGGAVFLVAEGIVRPYGPFTFATAQVTFCTLMLAVVLLGWELRRRLRLPLSTLAIGVASVIVMGSLSGARTFFLQAGGIVAIYLVGSIHAGLKKMVTALSMGTGITLLFVVTFVFVFPDSFAAMSHRQETAVAAEGSTSMRSLAVISPIPVRGPDISIGGEGAGIGSNMARAFLGTATFNLSEYENARVMQELGIVMGSLTLLARALLLTTLYLASAKAAKMFKTAGAFALFGFVVTQMLAGQISGQNQSIAFCWFAVGLSALAARLSLLEQSGGDALSTTRQNKETMRTEN